MRSRSIAAAAVAAVTILALAIGMALPAGAAPRQQSIPSAVTITAKNILPELSFGSPGFASRANRTVLAWTGTDPSHRLNVDISPNGITSYTNKIILRDTSIAGPSVAQMTEAAGNAVILAWTGTDASHRVNVMFDVYGQQKKMTYRETSFTSPAITIYKGDLLVAWAGTDANHSLNVMSVSLTTLGVIGKRTFAFGSNEAPTLATVDVEPPANATSGQTLIEAVLGWSNKTNHLQFANTTSGLNFTAQAPLAESSVYAPVMMQYHTEGGPEFWIAWTGTDAAHHLNVKSTNPSSFPAITGNKTVLPETAFGHPGLGFNNGLFITWTGTDSLKHLNVAEFQGF